MKRLSLVVGVLAAIVALAVGLTGAVGATQSATRAPTVGTASSKLNRILVEGKGPAGKRIEEDGS